MSSTYRVLCLSHDPAIALDIEWATPEAALAALADPGAAAEHPNCDLVVGRWSGALVEVCCPSGRCHLRPIWVDKVWLRLLAVAHDSKDVQVLAAADAFPCWPATRLARLRSELGLTGILSP